MTHLPESSIVDPDGDERRQLAAEKKRKFEGALRGARERAAMLPRSDIATLGYAVTDLMLMKLVRGDVVPKTAKEAADIARITLEIARRETGEADTSIIITTPEQRERAINTIKELAAIAQARAGGPAGALTSGAAEPVMDAEVIDVESVQTDLVPRVAPVVNGPAMMRLVRPHGDKET